MNPTPASTPQQEPYVTYQKISRMGWQTRCGNAKPPTDSQIQLGALLRIAEALENGETLQVLAGIRAALLAAAPPSPKSARAAGDAERQKREKASRDRAWEVYIKAGGTLRPDREQEWLWPSPPESAGGGTLPEPGSMSSRARKVFSRLNCKTLEQLAFFTEERILEERNCGMTTLTEFRELLAKHRLKFAEA